MPTHVGLLNGLAAIAAMALTIGHAVGESRSFARRSAEGSSNAAATTPLDEAGLDIVWLVSAFSVLLLEAAAIIEAALSPRSGLAFIASTAAGLLVGAVGIALRLRAIEQLGSEFAVPPAQSRPPVLVTSGPFAIVRHPSELGLLLLGGGLASIAAGLTTTAILVAVVVPLTAWRIGREERALRRRFGTAHAHYRSCTRLIWPGSSWLRLLGGAWR